MVYRGGELCRTRNHPTVIKATNVTWVNVERKVELHLQCDNEMGGNTPSLSDLINSGASIQV